MNTTNTTLPNRETFHDQLSRVKQMAADDSTWDLSCIDQLALYAVLASHNNLLAALQAQRCAYCGYILSAPRSLGGYACTSCAPARAVLAAAEGTS
jgi:hypothetical protein